jgi:hypothetical protein
MENKDYMKTMEVNIKSIYNDYAKMDTNPEIADFLNNVCDNIMSEKINIVSDNEKIKGILEILFNKFMYDSLWQKNFVRDLIKFGNSFYKIVVNEKNNYIEDFLKCNINEMTRKNYDNFNVTFIDGFEFKEEYQILHFRLLNNSIFLPYGESVLEKARKKFKLFEYAQEIDSEDDVKRTKEEISTLLNVDSVNLNFIREAICIELNKAAKIQLYYLGYDVEKENFSINFME